MKVFTSNHQMKTIRTTKLQQYIEIFRYLCRLVYTPVEVRSSRGRILLKNLRSFVRMHTLALLNQNGLGGRGELNSSGLKWECEKEPAQWFNGQAPGFHFLSQLLPWPRLTINTSLFLGNLNDDPTLEQCLVALISLFLSVRFLPLDHN